MAGFYRKLIPKLYFLSECMTLFPTRSFELYDIEKTPKDITQQRCNITSLVQPLYEVSINGSLAVVSMRLVQH